MARETLSRGTKFGPYRVERLLGAGAFGAVYEAINTKLDKPVALKVLHLDVAGNPDAAGRFVQEAKTVAKIRHPHIVDISDVDTCEDGAHRGVPYLAMELLAGETLAQRVERLGPLPVTMAVDLLLPIVSAVQAAHVKGIVHRDIKPDNIFVTELTSGVPHPKLLDFGIAKVRTGSLVQTVENAAIGTPAYSSPEQMTDAGSAGAGSDQWSLAVTLYHCLTGELPFDTSTGGLQGLIVRLCTGDPTPLRGYRPDVDPALEGVILRGLRKTPSDRFPTAVAFGAALLPFASAGTRERYAMEFRGSAVSTLGAHPAAGPGGLPGVQAWEPAPQPAAVGSLMGVSTRVEPTSSRRPRWVVATVVAVSIIVLGSGLGVMMARMKAGDPAKTRAAIGSPVVTPIHVVPSPPQGAPQAVALPTSPAPEPAAPTTQAVPAIIAMPTPDAALTEEPVTSRRRHRRPREGRTPRPARSTTTHPSVAAPRTGIPVVD